MARLRAIIITNGGTGYSSPPAVGFTGANGQTIAPVATAVIFGGSVIEIIINNVGNFTSNGPTGVTLTGGGGTGASAVPYNEETRPGYAMNFTLDNDIFNRHAVCPIMIGLTGHREFSNGWRDGLGTLQLDVTATPRKPTQTIIPGASGS